MNFEDIIPHAQRCLEKLLNMLSSSRVTVRPYKHIMLQTEQDKTNKFNHRGNFPSVYVLGVVKVLSNGEYNLFV